VPLVCDFIKDAGCCTLGVRSSEFINSCTLVSFAIVASNANKYRLNDSHCRHQSHFVVIVTFLGMFIKP
jgi:uncharacterized membrane protein